MNQKNKVLFNIISKTYSIEKIKTIVNMNFSRCNKIGEYINNTKVKRRNNICSLSSNISDSLPLNNHIENVLEQLLPFENEIIIISNNINIDTVLSCVIYFKNNPIIFIEEKLINKIAILGLSLDIDLIEI